MKNNHGSAAECAPPHPSLTRSRSFSAELRSSSWGSAASGCARYLLDRIGDLLGPPTCPACDEQPEPDSRFCPKCTETLRPLGPADPLADSPLHTAFEFDGALQKALHRLKYSERADLARPLGLLLERSVRKHASSWTGPCTVVPVPLHPRKLAERGYNQSALLGSYVARALGGRLDTATLRRDRATDAQARLDRDARIQNVAGAFGVTHPARAVGRNFVVVDDVLTTGSTLNACAATLREAGATSIAFVTLARAI